jgi:hypothetical protein
MEASMSTLEQRISAALSEDIASADVATLITDTEAAIAAADAAADAERVKALDPIASPDPAKARAALEDASFTRERLRTVLPRLQTRLKQVVAADYAAKWEPEFKRVEALRDDLAAEMREVYPAVVALLTDLFRRMAECDRECSRVAGTAPPGDNRRLLKVELTARGVKGLLQPDVWIALELRLPYFTRDSGPIYAWPPRTPSPFAYVPVMVPSGPGPDWHEELKARDVAQREESLRVIANLNERAREREERELKEGKEAIAREIAERNRRAGWGP